MKQIRLIALLLLVSPLGWSVDFESFQFIDHLLAISAPGSPELYEDAIIFTASSAARRVGVAFAHEGYAKVHPFKKLMKTKDEPSLVLGEAGPVQKDPAQSNFHDSGILFYVYVFPRDLRELEYRLIVDGLWTIDPRNPNRRVNPSSGIVHSYIGLPDLRKKDAPLEEASGSLRFTYSGGSGEIVTVGGSFNNWDPFMYELIEESPGSYALSLPLPPGTYRYAYFYRGERLLDSRNPRKVYTVDGRIASEAVVR